MFSSREARLIDERARKNAEMAPFNLNNWLPLVDTLRTKSIEYDSSKFEEAKHIVIALEEDKANT